MSHALLRKILAWHLDAKAEEVTYELGRNGKPFLSPRFGERLHFNLSHSKNCFAVAVSQKCEVGVDIEVIRDVPEADAIAQALFSPSERADIHHSDPAHRESTFLFHWTRKEAASKATGEGISSFSNSADVAKTATGVLESRFDDRCPKIFEFCILPNYVGAVAVQDRDCVLRHRIFESADACLDFLSEDR